MAKSMLSSLKYAEGSRKRVKRIGRGQGSGRGGTSTRGHKGARARAGFSYRPWFEGGQMPLVRRVPKYGFHSPFKTQYQLVNVKTLERMASEGRFTDGKVTPKILFELGAISNKNLPVKILGNGQLKTKLVVTADALSTSARQKIETVGGTVQILTQNKS